MMIVWNSYYNLCRINECNNISKKNQNKIKIVVNGAGASAMACTNLLLKSGVKKSNIVMFDNKGIINKKRKGLNKWKAFYASNTKVRIWMRPWKMQMFS